MLVHPTEQQQPQKVTPSSSRRYTRRSSVTRYSLEQMAVPSPIIKSSTKESTTTTTTSPEEQEEETPELVVSSSSSSSLEESNKEYELKLREQPPARITPKRRHGRRSSVTRYSLQQSVIPETRSLSPTPFSRRGSATKIIVEQVPSTCAVSTTTTTTATTSTTAHHQEGEEVTKQFEMDSAVPPRPKARYRRRCSVTKYSLDAAQAVANQHYAATVTPRIDRVRVTPPSTSTTTTTVAVKVTVEEPMDTVDSIEHRHMLANDTIESSGAGDLIVGWNQATASFMDNDEASTDGDDELPPLDDPASSLPLKSVSAKTKSILKSSPWWSGKNRQDINKGEASSAKEGNYIWGVLQKNFSVSPFWIKSLSSETIESQKRGFRDTSEATLESTQSIQSTPSA